MNQSQGRYCNGKTFLAPGDSQAHANHLWLEQSNKSQQRRKEEVTHFRNIAVGGSMDILLAIFVIVMPSAIVVVWLAWHSGNFDLTNQRLPKRLTWIGQSVLPNSCDIACHPQKGTGPGNRQNAS